MAQWTRSHRHLLDDLALRFSVMERISGLFMDRFSQVVTAVSILFVVILGITMWMYVRPYSRLALFFYLAVLNVLFLHAFGHLAQAILLSMYVPGLVFAILGVVPLSLVIYYRLRQNRSIQISEWLGSLAAGVVLFGPVFVGSVGLAKFLFPS